MIKTIIALSVISLSLTGCRGTEVASTEDVVLHLGAGSARSTAFGQLGHALADTLRAQNPGYTVDVQRIPGAVGSVDALQRGESDCAFSFANVAYEGFVGRLPGQTRPMDRLRGVALVQTSPLHFLASAKSGIRRVADLHARRVAFGFGQTGETGTSRAATPLLEAYRIATPTITREGEDGSAFDRLVKGDLDAVFFLTAQPSGIVGRAVAAGARLLSIEGNEVDALRQRYPLFRPSLIRAGTYQGQQTEVVTVGIDNVLLCRADLDPRHVQRVTRSWFITMQAFVKQGSLTGMVSPKLASATPIPLHAGAADFYRGRQVDPENIGFFDSSVGDSRRP